MCHSSPVAKNIHDAYRNRSVDWALNFGFGLRFLSHIDINARYGLGLTKAVRAIDDESWAKPALKAKPLLDHHSSLPILTSEQQKVLQSPLKSIGPWLLRKSHGLLF